MRAGQGRSVAAKHYMGRIADTDRALARAVAALLIATGEDAASTRSPVSSYFDAVVVCSFLLALLGVLVLVFDFVFGV